MMCLMFMPSKIFKPTDEFSDLPLRVAEITKEQRLRRESQYQENRSSLVVTNGGGKPDSSWHLAYMTLTFLRGLFHIHSFCVSVALSTHKDVLFS